MLVEGKITALLMLIVGFVTAYIGMIINKNKTIPLRAIPGIKAIEEGVGRATETGRSAFFAIGGKGSSPFGRTSASQTLLAFSLLEYYARLCARNNVELFCIFAREEYVPLADTIIYEAMLAEGNAELHNVENIRLCPRQSFSGGGIALIESTKPGVMLYAGGIALEQIIFGTAGLDIGAFQIAAVVECSFFLPVVDYAMLGDELYAATAQLSEDPSQLGTILGVDIGKWFIIVIALLGSLLNTFGNPIFINFFKL